MADMGREKDQGYRERRRGERGWMKITDLRGLKGAGGNERREQKGQGNRGK